MDSRRRVEWQNLPAELVSLIADRSDRRRLRAVCSSWRSSLAMLPNKPRTTLLSVEIPIPSFLQNQLRDVSLTLSEHSIYCLEPLANNDADAYDADDDETESRTWMVKLEEASAGTMWFYSTLSFQDIHTTESIFPAVVNLFESRVLLVGKEYNLKTYNHRHRPLHGKVVMSDDGDAILCALGTPRELMLFNLNHQTWTPIKEGNSSGYSDFIYHKHQFYIIYYNGKVTVVDYLLNVEDFVSPVRVEHVRPSCHTWLFVQSAGDLFLLRKSYVQNVCGDSSTFLSCFDVYRLDSDQKVWAQVTDIGDQSFFIGDGFSFAIRSEQFSGCGKNLVYHALEDDNDDGVPGNDVSIFDFKDNSSHMLCLSRRYSRLFWPIPSWLKPQYKVSKATIGALRSPV